MMIQSLTEQLEVDVTLSDLQAFTIDVARIAHMDMRRHLSDIANKFIEIQAKVIACQTAVRHIKANPQPNFLAPSGYGLGINKQILKALAAEMPGKRSHCLGNNLNTFTVKLGKAGLQAKIIV